jgi:hypothetical protein
MIAILVVNWNTRDLLRACLLSLRENLRDVENQIVVVDNASNDESAQMVRDEFPTVYLIENTTNEGYARGNNQAFEYSMRWNPQWIWLLNSDVEINEESLPQLLDFAQNKPQSGAFASALVDARDGHIQRSCRTFPTPRALWAEATNLQKIFARSRKFGFYRYGDWNMKTAREVEQPMTSSLLVRREAIEKIGGLFDEQFPIYFNDVDLCYRLRQHNFAIWFVPLSRVKHWGGASTNQNKPAMIQESHRAMEAFYVKHWNIEYSMLIYRATVALIRASGKFRYWRASRRKRARNG